MLPAEEIVAGYSHGGAKVMDRHGVVLYEFVDEFVQEDARYFGGKLAVEHRFAENLANGMVEHGLEVK